MPSRRSFLVLAVLAAAAVLAAGCGDEIGDACIRDGDCATDGTRQCDLSQPDGYCTILGCDHDTCPEEAVCVRFFSGGFANKTCDPATEDLATDMCSLDEVCAVDGHCALRSAEARFCMRRCEEDGDCRGGFECRTLEDMKLHGGEPVLPPGERLGADPPRFCAEAQ